MNNLNLAAIGNCQISALLDDGKYMKSLVIRNVAHANPEIYPGVVKLIPAS